jgi:hypothetical protein
VVLREQAGNPGRERTIELVSEGVELGDAVAGRTPTEQRVHFAEVLAHRQAIQQRRRGEVAEREVAERDAARPQRDARVREVNVDPEREDLAAEAPGLRRARVDVVAREGSDQPERGQITQQVVRVREPD